MEKLKLFKVQLLELSAVKARIISVCFSVIILGAIAFYAKSTASDHLYHAGDHIPLYAINIGPYDFPSETYPYYDLPFCLPADIKEKRLTFGEVLTGDASVATAYEIGFLKDKEHEVLCRKKFTAEQVSKLRNAVREDYSIRMSFDDLPIKQFLGQIIYEGIESSIPVAITFAVFFILKFFTIKTK